jgi:DNA-binding Lrp family transcriptional regulator
VRSDGLDTIDERIISCLVDDARASYAHIGGRVNLHLQDADEVLGGRFERLAPQPR